MITKTILVVLAVIVTLSSFITSQQALSEKQQQTLSKYLKDQLKSANTPQEIHKVVASLIKLGDTNSAQAHVQQLCDKVAKEAANVKNLSNEQLYHVAAAQLGLKCPIPNEQNFYDQYEKQLEKTMTDLSSSITDLEQAYNAARSLLLYRKKFKTLPNNNTLLNKVYNNIVTKYNDATGAFCTKDSNNEKCLADTGYAYETLSILHSLVNNKKDLLTSLVKVSKQAPQLLKKVASTTATKASSAFVRGLNRLASILPFGTRIERPTVEEAVSGFLRDTDNLNIDKAYNMIEGISSISSSNIHAPIVVSDITRDGNKYNFKVTNTMGQPIQSATIKIKAVYPGNNADDSLIGRAIEIKPSSNGVYTWTDADDQIANSAGAYKFDIDVQTADKSTNSYTRVFKSFASKLDISDVTISVGKMNDRRQIIDDETFKIESQGKSLDKIIPVKVNNDRDRLSVSFQLRGIEPQQTFVRIGDEKREYVASAKKSGGSTYRVEIPLEKITREYLSQPLGLQNPSGTLNVELMIADTTLAKPLLWKLGQVDLTFVNAIQPDEEGRHYGLQKEIIHKFNAPAARASGGIASTFSLIVAAPAALFVLGLLAIGFNFNNCPSGIDALLALVFSALIGCMLVVIGWYFIEINIFTALKYLSVLGIGAVLVGSRVLSAISRKSVSETN